VGLTILSSDDADSCPTSGSVEFTAQTSGVGGLNQCVSVAANTTYNFGYSYVQQAAGAIECDLFFYAGTMCPGTWSTVASLVSGDTSGTGWLSTSTSITSPAGAGSVGISCHLSGTNVGAGWLDKLYINTTANQY
jgi:hypothetical protein